MAAFMPNGVEIQKLLKHVIGNGEEDESDIDSKTKRSNGESSRNSCHHMEEEENFGFANSSTCWVCNGYYGPNFGEPLCGTCHAFLYHTQEPEEVLTILTDDEDSGNDEPPFKDKHEGGGEDDDEDVQDAVRNENNNDIDVDIADEVDVADENLDEDEDAGMVEPQRDRIHHNNNNNNDVNQQNDNNASSGDDEDAMQQGPENLPNQAVLRALPQNAENERYMLPIQRPRPLAPPALSHFVELLSDPRTNARELVTYNRNASATRGSAGILSLPVELTIMIFSYLDDISLWRVSTVCRTWENIISQNTAMCMWKKYIKERWPLFKSVARSVPNDFKLYSALMASCFCRTCFLEMALIPIPSFNHFRAHRLRTDSRLISTYASEGIAAIPLDKDSSYWQASILGPAGSPYEGGKFFLIIYFPESYPMTPPTVRFVTKILHPNVSRHGDVGIDIIQHNWSLALNVSKLLLSLQSLLTDPYTEVCMEPELGYMYENDRKRFEKLARQWTWRWAMFELMPPT